MAISTMRGDGWQLCCICFERHDSPYPNLFRDSEGTVWDVCVGDCAYEAGLEGE